VTAHPEVETAVFEIVRARGANPQSVDDELGRNGLGLDSIAIAEVVLECERRFGVSFGDLLEGPAITLRALAERGRSR
jgi:acyl carrier protein